VRGEKKNVKTLKKYNKILFIKRKEKRKEK